MDYFNEHERARQQEFAAMRDKLFNPITTLLEKSGVTPTQVTLTGVICLLLTCFMPPQWAWGATSLMALYVLCDGLDGPLARRLGHLHPGGALYDTVADHLGVIVLPAAAIYHVHAFGPVMVIFSSSYVLFIALIVYANAQKVRLRKFVRCKYLFFLLYLGSLFTNMDLLTYFCAFFATYYVVEIVVALRKIYAWHENGGNNGTEQP